MILRAMYEVAGGTTRLCSYEDIVVRAWELFPQEFGLRGYAELYPDASDVHKPLYGPLKRDGFVRVQNKKFGLTERGVAVAAELTKPSGPGDATLGRVRRDQRIEIERLAKKPVVQLVQGGAAQEELLDTDLYDFFGVTVRTKPADFAGRVTTVNQAIDEAIAAQDPSIDRERLAWVAMTRNALMEAWGELISERSSARVKPKTT
jgi:hypothetical protein